MQTKKEFFLTIEGLENLKNEYNEIIKVKRPGIVKAIEEARELGDLSENAEYHAAREEQGKMEARYKELEYMIENAVIIEEKNDGKVNIGSTVSIEYIDDKEIEEYTIVGSTEADPFENKISNESPIAKAILNHEKNDIVTVTSPNGNYDVKIVKIV